MISGNPSNLDTIGMNQCPIISEVCFCKGMEAHKCGISEGSYPVDYAYM